MENKKLKDNLISFLIIIFILFMATIITIFINISINAINESSPKSLNKILKNDYVNIYINNRSNNILKIGNIKIDKNTFILISINKFSKYITIEGYGKILYHNKIINISNFKIEKSIINNILNNNIYINCKNISYNLTFNKNYDDKQFILIETRKNNKIFEQTINFIENKPYIRITEVNGDMVKLSSRNIHKSMFIYQCNKKTINYFFEKILKNLS